jgi:hypothetical protein
MHVLKKNVEHGMSKAAITQQTPRAARGKTPAERLGRAVYLVQKGNETLVELTRTGVQKPKRLGNVEMIRQMSAAQEVVNEGLHPAAGVSGAFGSGALLGALGGYYVSKHMSEQSDKDLKQRHDSNLKFLQLSSETKNSLLEREKKWEEKYRALETKGLETRLDNDLKKKTAEFKTKWEKLETKGKHAQEIKNFKFQQFIAFRDRVCLQKVEATAKEAKELIEKKKKQVDEYIKLVKQLIPQPRDMSSEDYDAHFLGPSDELKKQVGSVAPKYAWAQAVNGWVKPYRTQLGVQGNNTQYDEKILNYIGELAKKGRVGVTNDQIRRSVLG